MTRASKSLLVLDGSQVKLRLLAERQESGQMVHVDWVRFTIQRRFAAAPSVDHLFPLKADPFENIWDEEKRGARIDAMLRDLPDSEQSSTNFAAWSQAFALAVEVASAMGTDFKVNEEVKKGHDFYRHRFAIERNGSECGWVGFLASGDSPRQQAQSSTIHCNLFGAACTFAAAGWRDRLSDIVETYNGDLTRCDLALDFFDGLVGGLDWVVEKYRSGACDVGGRRLKSRCVGDWLNGHERSLYLGSKEAGKETNIYEKGDQLFGVEAGSKWLRAELRYGNKLRELSTEMLRRPDDFFAGASAFHDSLLAIAGAVVFPEPVKCAPRLQIETVEAECTRNLRWMTNTAAASVAVAIECLGFDEMWSLIGNCKLPGRLQKFSKAELSRAFTGAFGRVSSVESVPAFG